VPPESSLAGSAPATGGSENARHHGNVTRAAARACARLAGPQKGYLIKTARRPPPAGGLSLSVSSAHSADYSPNHAAALIRAPAPLPSPIVARSPRSGFCTSDRREREACRRNMHCRAMPGLPCRAPPEWRPLRGPIHPRRERRGRRVLSDAGRQAPEAAFLRRGGRSGSGFQPAMMRAHSLAWTLSTRARDWGQMSVCVCVCVSQGGRQSSTRGGIGL